MDTKDQLIPEQEPEQEASDRFPDYQYEHSPNHLVSTISQSNKEWIFEAENGIKLCLNLFSDQLVRFRYAHAGSFERDFSYALHPEAAFTTESVGAEETDTSYKIHTSKLTIIIDKADLSFTVFDKKGQKLLEQAAPFYALSTIMKGTAEVKLRFKLEENDAFLGLGDKSGTLNLRGQKLENWNTDAFAFGPKTDPLYRSIPFFYGLRNGVAYGVFLHNTYRSHFDFGKENETELSIAADGGSMDFFFLYGPELNTVSSLYHQLTGLPELPPVWALGFHQCRWSYYPESVVRDLASKFREKNIPCDAIYLDIDYMDGYRCFTWNKDHFPDPKKMIADLRAMGFQTIVMIDPGIRHDPEYWVWKTGMEKDVFCKRTSGELMIGPVWPQACVFPDFTNPTARDWWGQLYRELYNEQGVSGFWNDMNEPAVFKVESKTFPDNVYHYNEGQLTDHRRIHNIYGLEMTHASYEGFKALKPKKRPFLLTRATFSGGQRYASVWTGDNVATWEHLKLASTQCQRLSISGFSFCGTDIGGFDKDPGGELLTRWLQLGVFHLLFRIHSMGNNFDGAAEADAEVVKKEEAANRQSQEPWAYGEPYTAHAREAINFRYQLLPYIYTAFWQHLQSGEPIIKSLVFYDQNDPELLNWEEQFLFNDQLLVCPVTAAGIKQMTIYLPEGKWIDYSNGIVYEGKKEYIVPVSLDRIPIFVKAGSVIANYPVQQYTGEKQFEQIPLLLFAGGTGSSFLYEDAGEGYDYQDGKYSLRQFDLAETANKLTLRQSRSGQLVNTYSSFALKLMGLGQVADKVLVDGKEREFKVNNGILSLTVAASFFEMELQFSH